MKSLYRRYRPIKLDEVVGQEQVTKPLANAIREGKISHAYLFIGPRGCGKTSVARIFAHEINGFKYEIEDDYVDIIEIDGASNRGIDNIRELREKVAIAPTSGKYKVYIIDEVHMLTKEAFNALLKTLEEPPEHVVFIMATTDAYKVPVTITSRAQTYTFRLADAETMTKHLRGICEKEGIKITDGALSVIAKRGGGSFRDSLSLLDQISTLSNEEITEELVISAMGLASSASISQIIESYVGGDVVKITTLLKEVLSSGVKAETVAEEMISEIIDNPRVELMELLGKLTEVKAPYAEARLVVALCNGVRAVSSVGRLDSSECHTLASVRNIHSSESNQALKPTEETSSGRTQTMPVKFNWDEFVMNVARLNDGIAAQLKSVDHEASGGVLHIYPTKKITRTILSRDNNKRILIEAAKIKVEVHDLNENPNREKDVLISKMSDIMGGEVQNDGGENPF